MKDEKNNTRGRPRKLLPKVNLKRLQFTAPVPLFSKIGLFANEHTLTVNGAIIRLVRMGKILRDAQENGGQIIIRQEGEKDREIMII